jgi:hypothetical protein
MRKSARALVLVVLSLLSAAVLGVTSAFMAAFALGAATALIVPGTGTPDANVVENYREHAADRYIAPFEPCSTTNDCNLVGIDYPASFWPLGFIGNWCPGFQCDKWDISVGKGVENLDTALRAELDKPCPTTGCEPIVIFGYSQGGAVVSNELRNIGDLTPAQKSRLSVVMIGNAYNPDGGFFTRLGFLGHVPGLDITFGQETPVDTGLPMTAIGFQYDPVMYAPLYWGNPFSFLNAVAALETVHGFYLTPNGNGPTDPIAYGYTEEELADILAGPCPGPNCRVDSYGNKYYMIPAKSLPIMNFVTSMLPSPLQPVAKPVVDLVSPVLKVLIDLGYDWSGDPGVERFLSPLPFNPIQNWPAVGVNLVAATVQGIQAFIGDLGGLTTTIAPSTSVPLESDTPVSTLAAARAVAPTETSEQGTELKTSTSTLRVVKDSDATVQQTVAEKNATSASMDETPVLNPESTADDKGANEIKAGDVKQTDETNADETGSDTGKKGETGKKPDETKADTDTKPHTDKKSETDKNPGADNKDADSGKAAA